jgi:dTDP-glucose 4,6-dehydratase
MIFRVDLQHSHHENYIRADVGSFRELEFAFQEAQPSIVYHLAAEFGRLNGEGWYERLWRTNAVGMRNVLELCERWEARLIFASSSEIYGEIDSPVLHEDLPRQVPVTQPNEYALSKWVNEVQIRNFVDRHPAMPLPIVCRFFNAYGPGEEYHAYRSVVALFCYRALHGLPFQVFEGYSRTFMYIEDFIPTLARVADDGRSGRVYNIGGLDFRSVEELAELVIRHTGADPALINRVGSDRHNVRSKQPSIERAKEDLGHDPTWLLERGVPETVAWMRDRYECP